MIKRVITHRILNWIFILFILGILTTAVYFYVSFQSKVKTIDASIVILTNLVSDKNLAMGFTRIISDFSNFAMLQVTTFFVLTIILVILVCFIIKLYLIRKKDFLLDDLTGVYNKKAIVFGLDYELKRALRFSRPLSVAVIDVDNFKKYNSLSGKKSGDAILKKIARIINFYLSKTNLVGRIHGDKFLIILPELVRNRALKILESIRQDICDKTSPNSITISTGLIEIDSKIRSRPDVFEELNKHLYLAKLAGRNSIK